MATAVTWVQGARPRTLPASMVPVVVGTAVASADGRFIWWRAVLAAVVALAMQAGTNFANDYSDGVRGTDDRRVGPVRLVGQGLASPAAVKRAAAAAFGVSAVAGLVLALVSAWWLVLVGAACIAAGYLYTGGPKPYGYSGLGELFVFVFFGLVATVGTVYVQTQRFSTLAVIAAVPVGLLAVALLVVNNLRDIPGDTVSGKRTLAVRLGPARTRALYVACLLVPLLFAVLIAVALGRPFALLGLGAAVLMVAPIRAVRRGDEGPALIAVLGATARAQLVFGALLAIGIAL